MGRCIYVIVYVLLRRYLRYCDDCGVVNVASLRKLRWRLDLRALRAFMKQAVGSSDLDATHHNTAR
jgi:hypothetical protein